MTIILLALGELTSITSIGREQYFADIELLVLHVL